VLENWMSWCDTCGERIWLTARDALALGVNVILDLGLPMRAARDHYRRLALAAGAQVHFHVVTGDPEVRFARTQARNADRGETFAIKVTDDMFKHSETWWSR
jgi:predicted kinase